MQFRGWIGFDMGFIRAIGSVLGLDAPKQAASDLVSSAADWASEPVRDIVGSGMDLVRDPFGRDLAVSEAEKARDYQTEERLAAEEFSSAEALAARQFNAEEALKARQHSEYLASTEYTRKMNSMRDAGLNPILAAGGWGAGSQVPSSAQAQGPAASSHSSGAPMASVQSMAPLQALLLAAQIRDISSASKLKDEQARDLAITRDPRVNEMTQRAGVLTAQIAEVNASTNQKKALVNEINKRIALLEEETRLAKSRADIEKAVADFETGVGGDIKRWSDAVGLKGRDVTHLIGAVVGFGKFAKFLRGVGSGSKPAPSKSFEPTYIDQSKPLEILIPPSWK